MKIYYRKFHFELRYRIIEIFRLLRISRCLEVAIVTIKKSPRTGVVLCLFIACMLVSVAIYFRNCDSSLEEYDLDKINSDFSGLHQPPSRLEENVYNSMQPKIFRSTWMKGKDAFFYVDSQSGNLMLYNATTNNKTVFVGVEEIIKLGSYLYYVSPDSSYILFAYNIAQNWRHSFTAQYKIFDTIERVMKTFPSGTLSESRLQYAGWSPSCTALSFVYENNLYYQESPDHDPIQLTNDGHPTDIFNGVPDWLYEEEIVHRRSTHYWSPDCKFICYSRIDDTSIQLVSWPIYGTSSLSTNDERIRYPKAGQLNGEDAGPTSQVDLFVQDVHNEATPRIWLAPPDELESEDVYFTRVQWVNNTHVYVTWMNRVGNHSISAFYDARIPSPIPATGMYFKIEGGWINTPTPRQIFIDSSSYLTIHQHGSAEHGRWQVLALYRHETKTITYLTKPKEEVVKLYAYDSKRNLVYCSSTVGDPKERHIVQVDISDPQSSKVKCITCENTEGCRYISATFSDLAQYYISTCEGPDVPITTLQRAPLDDNNVESITLEDNKELRSQLVKTPLPERRFFSLPLKGGLSGSGELFLPRNYNSSRKFSVLVYTYAGPASQLVTKRFPLGSKIRNWLLYLASVHDVIVVSADGRGTSGSGDDLMYSMYKNLGYIEVADQISLARYLNTLKMVNTSLPKAIFGWSYGGSTAAHALSSGGRTFHCGISVAPVVSFRYYDTAFSERHLGLATKSDGAAAYDKTSLIRKARKFRGKSYMLAHGTADDNVHFMQTARFAQALSENDILFRHHMYVDQKHGIEDEKQSKHLFHSMTHFLYNDCWKKYS